MAPRSKLLANVIAALGLSLATVEGGVGVHLALSAVGIRLREPSRGQVAVRGLTVGDEGKKALMLVTAFAPTYSVTEVPRRFVIAYDLQNSALQARQVVPIDDPWIATCAARAPYGFVITRAGEIYSSDLAQPQEPPALLGGYRGINPVVAECSDDGRLVFVAGLHGELWDRTTRRLCWAWREAEIRRAKFAPRSHQLFCGLTSGEIVELEPVTGTVVQRRAAHRAPVISLDTAPTDEILTSADASGHCSAVCLASGKLLWSRHFRQRTGIQFIVDGQSILVAKVQGATSVAFSKPWNDERSVELPSCVERASELVLAPDGTAFLCGGQPFVTVWNPASGTAQRVFPLQEILFRNWAAQAVN